MESQYYDTKRKKLFETLEFHINDKANRAKAEKRIHADEQRSLRANFWQGQYMAFNEMYSLIQNLKQKKMKVYLSKSNLANPNVVSKLRQLLIDNGFEVAEWTGGAYNIKEMLKNTVAMFQVTHPEGYEGLPNIAIYGRGITSEFKAAEEKKNPVYIYDGEDFYQVVGSKLLDENNYKTRWAKMELNNTQLVITDILSVLNAQDM
jgi:hypothetical protein